MNRLIIAIALVSLAQPATGLGEAPDEKSVAFFEEKIRPILTQHCLECHSAPMGKKTPKGGLRLDDRESLRRGGDSGPALVPGKPDESLILEVLRYRDAIQMPPKQKLSDSVVADFETWIKAGAVDPREPTTQASITQKTRSKPGTASNHWAYQSIRPSVPPVTKRAGWSLGPIDQFVLARLDSAGLEPVADADRTTLIRRVYFDLTGLPPTLEQIAEFENDQRVDAYERLVDRLLASKEFGERWGRHWLDIARFGESLTLRGMILPEAWRYRDYVIDTFNKKRPIDQFIREQVAGDLMSAPNLEERRRQLIATAYLALGNTNLEEQDKNQLRMDVVDEQLETIGKGLLGQTLGCARCHDHKFDPIPTQDYYALAGILRNTRVMEHANVSKWLERPLPMEPAQEAAILRSEATIKEIETRLARERARLGKSANSDSTGVVSVSSLPGIVLDDQKARQVGAWTRSKFSGSYIGEGYLHDGDAQKGARSLTFQPDSLPPGEYEVRLAYTPGGNRASNAAVTVMSADGEKSISVNERLSPPIGGRFLSLGRFRFEKGGLAYVLISNEGTDGHVVADAVQFLPISTEIDRSPRPPEPSGKSGLPAIESELKQARARAPKQDMALSIFEEAQIEDCKIHVRGSVHSLGPLAPRGFLGCVPATTIQVRSTSESGRRELADWLTSPENPLTARVFVNRVWHWIFGAGIVRTTDNFGTTGEAPSHPELLDFLASRFQADGWSATQLIREIVLSRTYRLSSKMDAKCQAVDPENRLLWRANRKRLDAECLRDAMLWVSGELEVSAGGPGSPSTLTSDYGFVSPSLVRSVYLPVFRNALPEILETFDFADPSVVTGRRSTSIVSPQALLMLNHPFVRDRSRHLARRILSQPGKSDTSRLDDLYRSILGRPISQRELQLGLAFLKRNPVKTPETNAESWATLVQALFASPEFRVLE